MKIARGMVWVNVAPVLTVDLTGTIRFGSVMELVSAVVLPERV